MSNLPSTSPICAPVEDEDDVLAELLAEQWMEAARQPGVFRLRALQAAGLLPPDGQISQAQIAAALGITQQRVSQLADRACLRLRHRLPPQP